MGSPCRGMPQQGLNAPAQSEFPDLRIQYPEGQVSGAGRYAVSRSKTGRGRASVVVFLLVPQVTIRKRLGLLAAAIKRGEQLPHEILQEWRAGGFL